MNLKAEGSDSETLPNLMLCGGSECDDHWWFMTFNMDLYWFAYIVSGYWLIVPPFVHSSVQCWCNLRAYMIWDEIFLFMYVIRIMLIENCNELTHECIWNLSSIIQIRKYRLLSLSFYCIPHNLFPSLQQQRMAPMIIPEVEIPHEMP